MGFDFNEVKDILVCPQSKTALVRDGESLVCLDEDCRLRYDIQEGIPIMLVDDAWVTIGSINTAERSFKTDTELNASIWHPETVKALRCDLFEEHIGVDTTGLSDIEAFQRFHGCARDNAWRKLAAAPMDGLAYRLNASIYGLGEPMGWVHGE